jgi:hypothetical protein
MMSILQNTTNIQATRFNAFESRQDGQRTQLYQQLQRQGISISLPNNDVMNMDEGAQSKVGENHGDATDHKEPPDPVE